VFGLILGVGGFSAVVCHGFGGIWSLPVAYGFDVGYFHYHSPSRLLMLTWSWRRSRFRIGIGPDVRVPSSGTKLLMACNGLFLSPCFSSFFTMNGTKTLQGGGGFM
jgi:hypothetical protein